MLYVFHPDKIYGNDLIRHGLHPWDPQQVLVALGQILGQQEGLKAGMQHDATSIRQCFDFTGDLESVKHVCPKITYSLGVAVSAWYAFQISTASTQSRAEMPFTARPKTPERKCRSPLLPSHSTSQGAQESGNEHGDTANLSYWLEISNQ